MNLNATIFGQIISFVLFFWFCMKYVWFPLISIIEKRQKEISDDLTTAKYVKIESDRINSEAAACLIAAKEKAQEIINHANTCKIHILNEAKYAADQERNRILSQAQEQIVYEKNRMIEELKQGIGQLVMKASEKIIGRSMDKKINFDFVEKIIQELSHED